MVLACRLAPYLQGSSVGPTPTESSSLLLFLFLSLSPSRLCQAHCLSFSRDVLDLMGGCVCREHYSLSRRLLANPTESSSRPRGSVTTLGNKSSFSREAAFRDSKSDTCCWNGLSGQLCSDQSLSTSSTIAKRLRIPFICSFEHILNLKFYSLFSYI